MLQDGGPGYGYRIMKRDSDPGYGSSETQEPDGSLESSAHQQVGAQNSSWTLANMHTIEYSIQ